MYFVHQVKFVLNYKEETVLFLSPTLFFFNSAMTCASKNVLNKVGVQQIPSTHPSLISVEISMCATALQTLCRTLKSISFTKITWLLTIVANIFTYITFQVWRWQSTRMSWVSSQCTQHTNKQPKVWVTWVLQTMQLVKSWPIGETVLFRLFSTQPHWEVKSPEVH